MSQNSPASIPRAFSQISQARFTSAKLSSRCRTPSRFGFLTADNSRQRSQAGATNSFGAPQSQRGERLILIAIRG